MTGRLEVTGLSKRYGEHVVLKGVGFHVEDGEGLAIIGPNGAGKTTLFKTLTGEISASAGTVCYGGMDITDVPAHARVRLGFGRTFQVARVFLEFTVFENLVAAIETRLKFQGSSAGAWYAWRPSRTVVEEAFHRIADIGLADKRFVAARTLSHGDKKRLELAISLAGDPQVLMMDEPTAGMSPGERRQIVELIQRIRRDQRTTVLLTEHDMDVVFDVADRILVLNYGEVIAIGTSDEIRSNPVVSAIYLGQEMIGA